ncbi:DUF5780 domain-containing protein [Staphylococcus sp. NRL 18/288]|nr:MULTISPECIES: DUF5780 domain-containing protein [unclassified Staphylococcus]MCJ1662252.1 DUF5780 domain-containing protein [Staphylococcus sp. NRL 18/288]MCJ1668329.1 DUF5780 domain-containing protein [Staphylococcus sp. NRL 19/737]
MFSSNNAETIDKKLKKQDVHVENVKFIDKDTDDGYLRTWDQLNPTIVNNSNKDIKEVTLAVVAWDKNGLPIKPDFAMAFSQDAYISNYADDEINLTGHSSSDKEIFNLESDNKIASYKIIVSAYKDFDGHTWKNPLYEKFEKVYGQKRLKDIKGSKNTTNSLETEE